MKIKLQYLVANIHPLATNNIHLLNNEKQSLILSNLQANLIVVTVSFRTEWLFLLVTVPTDSLI